MTTKTVLITGCSEGGIGDGLAREFHRLGLKVFATARSLSKMVSLKELGIDTLEMDVTSSESIAEAVQIVRGATGGRLDILVNNAGIQHIMPFADFPLEGIKRVFDTNVIGIFAVTQAFLSMLIEAKGIIANIGSINTVFIPPYQTPYNASKAAIDTFGDSLRIELAPLGVRVVTIKTGAVRSCLFENSTQRGTVPEGSLYYPLKERIEKFSFLDGVKWTSTEDYARQVANDLLRKNPSPVLWRASISTVARLVDMFGWVGMLVSIGMIMSL